MFKKLAIGAVVIILIIGVFTCSGGKTSGVLPWVIPLGLLGIGIFLLIKK